MENDEYREGDEENIAEKVHKKLTSYRKSRKLKKILKIQPHLINQQTSEEISTSTSTISIESTPLMTMKEKFIKAFLYGVILVIFTCFLFGIVFMKDLSLIGISLFIGFDLLFLILGFQLIFNSEKYDLDEDFNYKVFLLYFLPVIGLIIFFIIIFILSISTNVIENINFATSDPASIALPVLLIIYFLTFLFKSTLVNFNDDLEQFVEKLTYKDFSNDDVRFKHKLKKHVSYSLLILFISLVFLLNSTFSPLSVFLGICIAIGIINGLYFYFSDLIIDANVKRMNKKQEKSKNLEEKGEKSKGTGKEIEGFQQITSNQKEPKLLDLLKYNFKKIMGFLAPKYILLIMLFCILIVCCYIFDIFDLRTNISNLSIIIVENPFIIGLFFAILMIFIVFPLLNYITIPILSVIQKLYKKNLAKYFRMIFICLIFTVILKIILFNFQNSAAEWTVSLIISPILSYISNRLRMIRNIVT